MSERESNALFVEEGGSKEVERVCGALSFDLLTFCPITEFW